MASEQAIAALILSIDVACQQGFPDERDVQASRVRECIVSTTLDVSAFVDTSYSEELDENLAVALLHPGSMSEAREEHLLRVIRQEILPVLLAYVVPGGLEIVIRRLRRDYPDLDLFSKD